MAIAPKPPIKRQTVTDSVAEYITDRIVSGDYPGGHQIRQEAIAAELGVSRIPVREALLQLEAEGLVINRPHRGAVVANLSLNDAIELFDARLLLEPFLVRRAIEKLTEADIAHVSSILDTYERSIANKLEPSELSKLNWAFHTALLEPAGRPRTMAVIQTLFNSADRYLRLQIEPAAAQEKALREHQIIFQAYASRNGSLTARLLKKHIADAADEIVRELHLLPAN